MRKPIHRKLEVTKDHWTLISGRSPTDELSFPSERLQVIFNHTSTPWPTHIGKATRSMSFSKGRWQSLLAVSYSMSPRVKFCVSRREPYISSCEWTCHIAR
jgi:hypothetical protein